MAVFDFRFGWSHIPILVLNAASALFLFVYGIVRHPMYVAAQLLFITMPLVLVPGMLSF